jgi:sarcosine oxidase subunit gamma
MRDQTNQDLIDIRERADLTLTILRLRNGDAALPRLAEPTGMRLPLEPGTFAADDGGRACWIAPNEWLLIRETPLALGALAQACDGVLHYLTDATDGRVVFELSGAAARDVIAKACSLDLHERAFASGRCAQTMFAQIPVFIARTADRFTLVADASYAVYLRAWLADATLEYEQ